MPNMTYFSIRTTLLLLLTSLLHLLPEFCQGVDPNTASEFDYLVGSDELDLIFHPFGQSDDFTRLLGLANNDAKVPSLSTFQWLIATGLTDKSKQSAWIVYGGSIPSRTDTGSLDRVFTKSQVGVIACRINIQPNSRLGLRLDACQVLSSSQVMTGRGPTLLGAEVASLTEPSLNVSLLVYCDPLWRSSSLSQHPTGLCMRRVLGLEGVWSDADEESQILFCSTKPCGGGSSVDLTLEIPRNGYNLPNVKLAAGLPFVQPYGEVGIVDNLLSDFDFTNNKFKSNRLTTKHLVSNQPRFGSKLVWTPTTAESSARERQSFNFATLTNQESSNWSKEQLIMIASSIGVQGYRLPENNGRSVFTINQEMLGDSHSGLGQSLETLVLDSTGSYAVLIGAPYTTIDNVTEGSNTGRVYVVCPEQDDKPVSFLTGKRQNEMFGYSLARLGDVDGDGIDDVAIGAPALSSGQRGEGDDDELSGRVYIHRLTRDCKLDANPLQVLQAETSVSGFGLGLSRGFDADGDRWPEFAVTSPTTNPVLFTMSARVKAKCLVSTVSSSILPRGSKLAVQIQVSLIGHDNSQPIIIPDGVASHRVRLHQIDPDVEWKSPSSNQSTSIFGRRAEAMTNDDDDQIRFSLVSLTVSKQERSMLVRAELKTKVDSWLMQLHSTPLQLAYRSSIDPQGPCASASTASSDILCFKSQQPLIDWSECIGNLDVGHLKCLGADKCSADLEFVSTEILNGHGEKITPEGDSILAEFADKPNNLPRNIKLRLINKGPTKASGVVVMLNSTGITFENTRGVRIRIMEVLVSQNGILSGDKWDVKVAENELTAILTLRSVWLFVEDEFDIDVVIAFEGLVNVDWTGSDPLASLHNLEPELNRFGLEMFVSSAVDDPVEVNNKVTQSFKIIYQPRIAISALNQPATIIDDRRKPVGIYKGMRLLASELGPKLTHSYLIENRGRPNLINLTFALDLPFVTSAGDQIIYLLDKTKLHQRDSAGLWINRMPSLSAEDGQRRGECFVPSSLVNPLGLTVFTPDDVGGHASNSDRDQAEPTNHDGQNKEENVTHLFPGPFIQESGRHSLQRLLLSCPAFDGNSIEPKRVVGSGVIRCLRIMCHLDSLPSGDAVRLKWIGWLLASTAFTLTKPDIQYMSRLTQLNWGPMPTALVDYSRHSLLAFPRESKSTLALEQKVVFQFIQPKVIHQTLKWSLILGIVLGILILAVITALFYASGCFRRQGRGFAKSNAKTGVPFLLGRDMSQNNSAVKSPSSVCLTEASCNLLRAEELEPPPTPVSSSNFVF